MTTTEEPTAPAGEPAAEERPVSFWHRPNVERYLVPLITPVIVVVGLVVYVLNLSRVFLSAHGHTAVVVGSVVTALILLGATVLSNSARLRSQTLTLMTAGFVLVVLGSGWLVLGHSQEKNVSSAALPAAGPYSKEITITASPTGGLTFGPSSVSVTTGVYEMTLVDGASISHTLNFDQSSALFSGLVVNGSGEKHSSRIFFGAAGDYTYYCAIPGHRAAGMQGVVHVTGPTMTLAQAEAAGKLKAT